MKILFKKVIILFTLTVFVMTSAHSADFISQEGVSHSVLTLLDDPRNEEPWSQLITNQDEWESFFNAPLAYMTFPQSEVPTAPQLDFENYQVLTGGLGVKPSSGYILSVEKVKELDDVIDVHVLVIKPGPTCISLTVLSYPSTAILIKKTEKPFNFTFTNAVREC